MDNESAIANLRSELAKANEQFPDRLTPVDKAFWPEQEVGRLLNVWRSRTHIVRQTRVGTQLILSIQRAEIADNGEFVHDKICWSEIMQVKAELGFADTPCLELYPAHKDVLHELTTREIWLCNEPPEVGWRVTKKADVAKDGHTVRAPSKCEDVPDAVVDTLLNRAQFLS